MARSARQQRRQRRQESQGDGTVAQRGRAKQQPVRPGAEPPPKQQTPGREPPRRGRFLRESWGELQKVDWPGRNQVTQGTIVVIIACAIVGAYLWVLDLGIKQVVENVILRGA